MEEKQADLSDADNAGDDWWMNELEPNPQRYHDMIRTSLTKRLPDRVNDIMGDSALRFLGFRKDDGTVNDCNPNWRRLATYYKNNNCHPPEWLAGELPSFCITNGA